MNAVRESTSVERPNHPREIHGFEVPVDVRTAARFLGISPSLVYAYVERKQIPHFRMMGRAIRFSISELEKWRQKFFVDGGINDQDRKTA
jgi:excisionase family DNA binding protein